MNTLILPTSKKEIVRPWFLPSAEALEEQRRIAEGRFFLIRISGNSAGLGEWLICKRCNAKHQYITLMCVERPFSSLTGGLYAYYTTIGDLGLLAELSEQEKARYYAIRDMLSGSVDDISESHPNFVKGLNVETGDGLMGAIAYGVVEPIPRALARKYVDKINERGLMPKLVL